MHGSSLESLLKYHIRGMNNDRRDYLNLEIPVSQMLQEFPDLEIEVHVMFGFKDCVEKIQQAYSVNIVIHNEISSDFCSDKTTNDLVENYMAKVNQKGFVVCFVITINLLRWYFQIMFVSVIRGQDCFIDTMRKSNLAFYML